MASGPEHYREAERLLRLSNEVHSMDIPLLTSRAQVHATLALAAATAMREQQSVPELKAWIEATK